MRCHAIDDVILFWKRKSNKILTNVPFDFPIKIQIPINVTKVKLSIVETIAIMINFLRGRLN